MPIYEYRCTSCGHIEEEWVKSFNSPMSEPCPKCGAEAVRIVSDTSFQLKGTGWYVTDYKKSGTAPSHESASGSASSDAKSEGVAGSTTESSTSEASTSEAPKGETASVPAATDSKPTESKATESKTPESKTASAAA